jgi:hypothetical protein
MTGLLTVARGLREQKQLQRLKAIAFFLYIIAGHNIVRETIRGRKNRLDSFWQRQLLPLRKQEVQFKLPKQTTSFLEQIIACSGQDDNSNLKSLYTGPWKTVGKLCCFLDERLDSAQDSLMKLQSLMSSKSGLPSQSRSFSQASQLQPSSSLIQPTQPTMTTFPLSQMHSGTSFTNDPRTLVLSIIADLEVIRVISFTPGSSLCQAASVTEAKPEVILAAIEELLSYYRGATKGLQGTAVCLLYAAESSTQSFNDISFDKVVLEGRRQRRLVSLTDALHSLANQGDLTHAENGSIPLSNQQSSFDAIVTAMAGNDKPKPAQIHANAGWKAATSLSKGYSYDATAHAEVILAALVSCSTLPAAAICDIEDALLKKLEGMDMDVSALLVTKKMCPTCAYIIRAIQDAHHQEGKTFPRVFAGYHRQPFAVALPEILPVEKLQSLWHGMAKKVFDIYAALSDNKAVAQTSPALSERSDSSNDFVNRAASPGFIL